MTRFSPTYCDFVPESIEKKVAQFGLGDRARRLFWEVVRTEVRTRRDSDFVKCVAPVPCLILRLTVPDSETDRDWDFAVYISNRVRPGARTLIDVVDLNTLVGTIVDPEDDAGPHPSRPQYE